MSDIFDTVSSADVEAAVADAIVGREREIASYSLNVANYEAILASLPNVWPTRLQHLRAMDPQTGAAECPLEDLELLADLQQHDRVSALLRTEIVERQKSRRVLDALNARLSDPVARKAALDAAVARQAG